MFHIPTKESVEIELRSLSNTVQQARSVFEKAASKTGGEQVTKADQLAKKVGNYRSGLRYLKYREDASEAMFFDAFNRNLYYQIRTDAIDCLTYIRGMCIDDAEQKVVHIQNQLHQDIDQKHALALIEKMHYHRKQLNVYNNVDGFITRYLEKVNWLSVMYGENSNAEKMVENFFQGKLESL
jgi:hypothetical protein